MSKTPNPGYSETYYGMKCHHEDPDYVEPDTTTMSTLLETNRFDPYEALELIDRANLSPLNLQDSLTLIHEQVGLLRSYITGMER